MAVIQSGASSDTLTVGVTSKAARAELYDANGRALAPVQTGSYLAQLEVRHTSAAAAGVTVFNMRGPTSLSAYIRRIMGTVTFDGTALAASGTLRYGLYRGTGAASPTGGAALVPTKKKSTMGTSTLADIRTDITGVGLTTAGITYETNPFYVASLPIVSVQVLAPATSASPGPVISFDLEFHHTLDADSDFIIGANEHVALRLQTVAAVIGFGVAGAIAWDER